MRCLTVAIFVLAFTVTTVADDSMCGSYKADEGNLDLAPPPGFVEVCSRNEALCDVLTRGYPPSVTTLGYFVTEEEWSRFQESQELGFKVYLIAQIGGRMSDEEFGQFKGYVKSQQGQLPDNTELPAFIEKHGQAPLGVLSETDDSIAFGTVMKLATEHGAFTLAASNIGLQLPQHSLILYVYHEYNSPLDVESLRRLTDEWLNCLRSRNEPPPSD